MNYIGRNSPCPCGSGLKFRKCCGALRTENVPQSAGRESIDVLERASQSGDMGASLRLGLRYLSGHDTTLNPTRGVALIESAARAGDAQGAFLAATLASAFFWRERNWDTAFDYLSQAAQLGHEAAQDSLRILAGGPGGRNIDDNDWAAMRESIDLAAWLAPPATKTLHESPRILAAEKFAPPAACDWLIAQARNRLSRATIYDNATGGTTEDTRRTNSQCDLGLENSGVLTFVLRGRIAALTGRHDRAMEIPKILHYQPGETFAPHFDFLDSETPAFATELAERGQRTHTFLLYLNDEFAGGETSFLKIGLSHVGAKGDALLFTNVTESGQPDENTMHAGMPPTSGEKWVFSQWIREFPRI
ncbi:MAG: hypothetical protein HKN77_10855 [Woeseiaceae bacterium]|nr:hypothetical protein [Woeseiaceae bacterium]